ncbi:hypothetical protein RRG08_060671 [Elysia crispata]|uniref:Uncharacterized protein n=1 Tax=Elysia crispata TaxID=231223 RepID=A0AAE1ASB7_9GAST|nr:hypothetical protein RRG08_060671 [Elysia crispata]
MKRSRAKHCLVLRNLLPAPKVRFLPSSSAPLLESRASSSAPDFIRATRARRFISSPTPGEPLVNRNELQVKGGRRLVRTEGRGRKGGWVGVGRTSFKNPVVQFTDVLALYNLFEGRD